MTLHGLTQDKKRKIYAAGGREMAQSTAMLSWVLSPTLT